MKYVPVERLHPGAAKYYREVGLLPASHANEQATRNGKLLSGTRTEQFMQAARVPVHIPLSGQTMAFNEQGNWQSGCD